MNKFMRRKIYLMCWIVVLSSFGYIINGKEIKNVILMIPDGTSWATVSSARWYQWYNNPEKPSLHIDPYLCGSVFTFSSNAPIGDSAPTTSCFMTGVPSRAGYVSTYPEADIKNDIYPLDPSMAYQPLMTVLEVAKSEKKMATGLVVTCEFPHATPADCAAHSYNRGKYDWIAPQMVHNDLDVVIGGGVKILNNEMKAYLEKEGYGVYLNDIVGFRSYTGDKMWSLFCDYDMPYDIDRDPALYPSLAEMTSKAIEKLSQNENGFFLMVEGSKIDWAAHANDPAAMITDMLAFDEACGIAFDFANNNQETIVIVVPDHGNSGISIGSNKCGDYANLTKDDLFKNISKFKVSVDGLLKKIHDTDPHEIKNLFREYMDVELSDEEVDVIVTSKDYKRSNLSDEERMKGTNTKWSITKILNDRTCFGFTTGGHTGEEVFLAIYDPNGNRPTGFIRNFELTDYMFNSLNLPSSLPVLTQKYFAKHTDVFDNYSYKVNKKEGELPVLEVSNKKKKLSIHPFTNIVKVNDKEIKLNSVIVYVDRNDTFYLPDNLVDFLK